MRHIKFFAITIAMFATLFSCQKQEELPIDNGAQTLTAYAPGSGNIDTPDTRVSFEDDEVIEGQINLDWQVDDVITIYDADDRQFNGNYKVSKVDAATGKATFVHHSGGTIGEGQNCIAVYPASTTTDYDAWAAETWWTKELTQSANNSLDHLDDNLRMTATFTGDGSTISFAHEAAIMSVTFESSDVPTVAKVIEQGRSYITNLTNFSTGVSTAHFIMRPSPNSNPRAVIFTVNNDNDTKKQKSTATRFEAGKRYQWNTVPEIPAGLFLANINADNIPEGDTWTIEDTDATAGSTSNFAGLKAALEACAASRTITIVFPNLTYLPPAFFNIGENGGAKYKVIANSVTSGEKAFMDAVNLVEVQLEGLTDIGDYFFTRAENLTALTIAKNSRITNISGHAFTDTETVSISITTHADNANGFYLEAENGTKAGPFDSMNGVKSFAFAANAAILIEDLMGHVDSYTLIPSRSLTLYIGSKNNGQAYSYPNTKWSSSNSSIVSVSQSQGSEVVINALKKGTATITAEDEKGNKRTLVITVKLPAPTNITFTVAESNKYHPNGKAVYIPYTVTPADADVSQLDFDIKFTPYEADMGTDDGTEIEVDAENKRLVVNLKGEAGSSYVLQGKLTVTASGLPADASKSFDLYVSGYIYIFEKGKIAGSLVHGDYFVSLNTKNYLNPFATNSKHHEIHFAYAKNSGEYNKSIVNSDIMWQNAWTGVVSGDDYNIFITKAVSDNPSKLKSIRENGIWYLYSEGLGQSNVKLRYGIYETSNNFTTTH